jgi:Sortase domain
MPALPARLAIPVLSVDAPVQDVLAASRILEVPNDPSHVGWWVASALVGAPSGAIVMDGHVDAAGIGPGALFGLGKLRSGDRVDIVTTSGQRASFRVYARQVLAKRAGLPASLFGATGPAQLILISCGGSFDRVTKSYDDNIVVYAAPVG